MKLTGGPGLGHCASIRVDYDQLSQGCSAASLSHPTSVVNLICLAVHSVLALYARPPVDGKVGALEQTL